MTKKCVNPAHLRSATHQENRRNRSNRKTLGSASGFKGVYPTSSGRWKAVIGDGGSVYLGTFDTIEEAITARTAASIKLYGAFSTEK